MDREYLRSYIHPVHAYLNACIQYVYGIYVIRICQSFVTYVCTQASDTVMIIHLCTYWKIRNIAIDFILAEISEFMAILKGNCVNKVRTKIFVTSILI